MENGFLKVAALTPHIRVADPRNYEAKEQSKMKIAIYQINSDRDSERIAFVGLNSLERRRGSKDICPEIYDKVYEAEVDGTSLEDVYEKFNIDKPDDYKARSLSVSDVVEVIFATASGLKR